MAALVLGACGSSDEGSPSTTTSSTTSSSTTSTSATTAAEPEITVAGYRGLTWGMTLAQASAALGATVSTDGSRCTIAASTALPKGATFWVVDGRIVMAEIGSPSVPIAGGRAHVDDREAAVRQALGREVEPQLSDDQTRTDLVLQTADPAMAGNELRFVIIDGKVFEVNVGLRTFVEQQELCG
jgi:hypothetical protein